MATFSPDGSSIVSWGNPASEPTRLWDADGGELLTTFRREGHVSHIEFAPDGSRFLTVTWDNRAQLWDLHQEESLRVFQHTKRFRVPAFADGGASLIAQGDDKVMRWNVGGDRTRTIEQQQRDYERKTATRLDSSGRLLPLSFAEWKRRDTGQDSP